MLVQCLIVLVFILLCSKRDTFIIIIIIVGIEARGFIFGPPIALAIGARFVPLRKPGKLPGNLHMPMSILPLLLLLTKFSFEIEAFYFEVKMYRLLI